MSHPAMMRYSVVSRGNCILHQDCPRKRGRQLPILSGIRAAADLHVARILREERLQNWLVGRDLNRSSIVWIGRPRGYERTTRAAGDKAADAQRMMRVMRMAYTKRRANQTKMESHRVLHARSSPRREGAEKACMMSVASANDDERCSGGRDTARRRLRADQRAGRQHRDPGNAEGTR
ncbi:hypothetical protein C8R44DRAFT_753077 [Mycena epipterygia]|nr:hypothetical protein C8R44DRAFT_753077 [Mycena epipterygia]